MGAGGRPAIVMLVLLGLLHNAAAATYLVGQPSSNGDSWTYVTGSQTSYDEQFSSVDLVVGDVLSFLFTSSHDVYEVPSSAVAGCDSSNPISTHTSSANITLESAGQHGFICTIPGHCSSDGMHLLVTVNEPAAPATSPASAPYASDASPSGPVTSPSSAPVTSPIYAPFYSDASPSAPPSFGSDALPSGPVTSPASAPYAFASDPDPESPPSGLPSAPPQKDASFQLKSLPAVLLGSLLAACAVLAL